MSIIFGLLQMIVMFAVAALVGSFMLYNKLQRAAQEVRESMSNVQIAISKKLSLVNQLVDVVKNYQNMEQLTHLQVSKDSSAAALASSYQESGALVSTILGVANRFPDLKANEQYHRLIDSMQSCEQDIQFQRKFYNHKVKDYNATSLSAPAVFVAKPMGFGPAPYLEFDITGATDATSLKEFKTDDGERLRELLSKASDQIAHAGRGAAAHAKSAGRTISERMANEGLGGFAFNGNGNGAQSQSGSNTPSIAPPPPPPPGRASSPADVPFYYLTGDERPLGPIGRLALLELLTQRQITDETLIVEVGGAEWRSIKTLRPDAQA